MTGTELQFRRRAVGISSRELAAEAGISQTSVWRAERSRELSQDRESRLLTALSTLVRRRAEERVALGYKIFLIGVAILADAEDVAP